MMETKQTNYYALDVTSDLSERYGVCIGKRDTEKNLLY